ncbi:hypothetical protein [Nonlabens ponticola]|uniref:Lipocalin-like domain-containing protein n=1 Tax=Nonlabens ponticola TaxID=2496866 RepID=A0A3S9MX59_9FLAO|nr:hypothetical protein [Nonlabens ponticola]AZQ43728.1 hypothetical protein EJ995_05605 [Nonlabens ponticola]
MMRNGVKNFMIACAVGTIIGCYSPDSDFDGTWYYEDATHSMTLELKQEKDSLIGHHCLVIGKQGKFIDCADDNKISVKGIYNKDKQAFELEIVSEYLYEDTLKGYLKADVKDQLLWQTTSEKLVEGRLPKRLILKSIQE